MRINKVFKAGECEMDVWVEYNTETNIVEEILRVYMSVGDNTIDTAEMLQALFSPCLERLIRETDWREECYQQLQQYAEI